MTSQEIQIGIVCQGASYSVNNELHSADDDCKTWILQHDTRSITTIEINLSAIRQPGGHIRIDKFVLSGQPVHHWDRFGVYRTIDGKTKKTYGWMDEPGVYRFKIRYSQNLHCFVMYLLDLGQ